MARAGSRISSVSRAADVGHQIWLDYTFSLKKCNIFNTFRGTQDFKRNHWKEHVIIPYICFFQSCRILTGLCSVPNTLMFMSVVVHNTTYARVILFKDWTAVWQRQINITPDSLQWAGCKMERSLSLSLSHTHTHLKHIRVHMHFLSALWQFAATFAHLRLSNALVCCSGLPSPVMASQIAF